MSPDPLAVHGIGGDPNLYGYVAGHALLSIDPLGLDEKAAIRVNTAPEGVKAGEYFFVAPGSGGAQGFSNIGDLRKAAADKGVPVFQLDPSSSVSLKVAQSEPEFFQAIANLRALMAGATIGDTGSKGTGSCSGPACTGKPGQKGAAGPTDASDAIALAGGIAAGETELKPGGSSTGSPGGQCTSCEGSKAQQVAIGATRIAATVSAAKGVTGALGGQAAPAFRAFTRKNFRHNLAKLTGISPKNADAHHVFPAKFEAQFARAGVNVHDPKFGAWWESGAHRGAAAGYNQAWQTFFERNPGATSGQILDFGRNLAGKHAITIRF